ncbi:MAG: DNA topoisomerase IB [Gemmatimonadota bacterium]|nr:DNA topoisomerase IB [Gemmatimonadota bacterium]
MARKWIVREGSKTKGFRYKGPTGHAISDPAQLERINVLRIPPAWRDVHISTDPKAAIQVWGFDARGRKQYKYHRRAVEKGELRKYYRVRQMARDLPTLRSRIQRDFRGKTLTKEKVCAGIVRLISHGFFRVGSERYEKENNTFGITTMRKSHVLVLDDTVEFEYRGKRSIAQRTVVVGSDLARFINQLLETPGPRLFRYLEAGKWQDVDSGDVNEYIESIAQFPYTAKDFRTWGGTLRAATVLADLGKGKSVSERKKNVVTAVRLVAAELGNTPTICRKSYVHPVVVMKYLRSGATIALPKNLTVSSNGVGHAPEESALIEFLDEYFPERRKEPRVE